MAAPSLSDEQRDLLVSLLAAGERESAVQTLWRVCYGRRLASATLSYWRKKARPLIDARRKERIERALDTGLALKAERVAALKDHAEQLAALKFVAAKSGRLFNEKAWRETLADIAVEMGDRKPKDAPQEQTVKVYVGLDPDRV
jgi:hypothetical protein